LTREIFVPSIFQICALWLMSGTLLYGCEHSTLMPRPKIALQALVLALTLYAMATIIAVPTP